MGPVHLGCIHPALWDISHPHPTTFLSKAQPGHGSLQPQQLGKVQRHQRPQVQPGLHTPAGMELGTSQLHRAARGKTRSSKRPGNTGSSQVVPALSPSPALFSLRPTRSTFDPDEPHKRLGLGARRCQRCWQRGWRMLARQDGHLLRAAGQLESKAQAGSGLPGEGADSQGRRDRQ